VSPHELSLFQLFLRSAMRVPHRPALTARGTTLTYAELAARAAAIAAALVAARGDVLPGRCALLGAKGPGTYAGVLGILAAGCSYVPLNPRFPSARSTAMLGQARASALVVAEDAHDAAKQVLQAVERGLDVVLAGVGALPAWCAEMDRHRFRLEPAQVANVPEVEPEDIAYLLFTSGSTGAPKGIGITHANARAYLDVVRRRYAPNEFDRFSQVFDLTFDLSMHDMFLCWAVGGCLCAMPATGGLGTASYIRRNELTFWFGVPSTAVLMARLGELAPGAFPSLRWSLFCGEALPVRLARAWQAAAPASTLENLYGPTEATIAFTAYRVPADLPEDGVVPIGLPFDGQHVALLDEAGNAVPLGEVGELYLGGSQIAPGYWERPDLTAERFRGPAGGFTAVGRWYRSGDLVVLTQEYGLLFRGRADRQVKIRGYRVELQEIEDAMRAAGGLDFAAVLPWPPPLAGAARAVVGFVPRGADIERIMAGCRARLPDYMVPTCLHEIAEWPLNANGKTDYAALSRDLLQIHTENRQ